jgi:large subunit ribosomal protein L18e
MKSLRTIPYSATGGRTRIETKNPQLLKLQGFFKKIVDASADAPVVIRKIEKRLRAPKRVRQPVKISMLLQNKQVIDGEKTAVVVAKLLDDDEIMTMPKLNVVALSWSQGAKQKILANGGSLHTIDEFIKVAGSIDKIELVAQDPNHRNAAKHWGAAPGEKNSVAYPYANHKCQKHERRLRVKKSPSLELDN